MPCASFSMLDGPDGTGLSIENDSHVIKKLLLKTQASEKFLHSEMNLTIQHIIVQDQDGQNIFIIFDIERVAFSLSRKLGNY